ncbi:EVE domain-containing protein [Caballeronia grimmiae]|uniref:EVE domain-containing protein n=1 Tax=Caballeronia grimmiae TaxID=1071679 RepID=UPI0038B6FC44
MTSWIFQGNPSTFDLDGYLHAVPGAITWLVKRHAQEMEVGDTVFLWRSQGKDKANKGSGVVASAEIVSPVSSMVEEAESRPFWVEKSGLGTEHPRVWLKLERVANKKEELKRDWLMDDEILKNMLIVRQPAGTNFKLTTQEGDRLTKMWSRVGKPWSRSESLAGLWAYAETYGKEVSKSTGSPVRTVSKLTGRAITGVYNKVMNFRAIDPRDDRQGMSGAGTTDRAVWAEFFNVADHTLDEAGVNAEFNRLWANAPADILGTPTEQAAVAEVFTGEVEKLLNRSLDDLMAAYGKQQTVEKTSAAPKPKARPGRTTVFQRNPLVVAIARIRAASQCEAPGCSYELFDDHTGTPYCEVHHILPLSQGGADTIENVICLCPAHHKEAHFGKRSCDLRQEFENVRSR